MNATGAGGPTDADKDREKLVKLYGRAPQDLNKGPLSHKLKVCPVPSIIRLLYFIHVGSLLLG